MTEQFDICVTKAEGAKCPRCWKVTIPGLYNFDGLCDHCAHLILDLFPEHESVQFIRKAYAEQRRIFQR